MSNGVQVVSRSAEGTLITSHMLTDAHSRSPLDEVRGARLRGQEDGAKQEMTGAPLPPEDGFRARGGGGFVTPKERFVFRLRAPCGAAYELQSSRPTTAASGYQSELLLVYGFILQQECGAGGCFAALKLSLI